MSLINKMLQDLEARRATLSAESGAAQEIRSLPPERSGGPKLWIVMAAFSLVLLLAVGGWWFMGNKPASQAQQVPPLASGPSGAAPAQPAAARTESSTVQIAREATPDTVSSRQAPLVEKAAVLEPHEPPAVPAKAKDKPKSAARPAEQARPPAPPKATQRVEAGKDARLRIATTLTQAPQTGEREADDGARIEKKMRMSTPRERAENEYRRALALVNQGRISEGTAVLRGALSENATHLGARLALFSLLVEQQRYEEAQSLLNEALARDPAQPQLASRLARLQWERGDVQGAETTLRRSAGAAQGNPEFRGFHAAVLQRLTLHKEAVTEYQAALRLAPEAGVWWMGLGISLEADGRSAEAREAYQRARASGALSAELDRFVEQKLRQQP